MFDAAPKRPSLRLSCSRKLGSVCSGVTLQRHTLVLWFLIIERKSCQNNFPGASLLSVQCTVHSVRASSAASVLFREVRQRVFCPPGQPWIHYFSLVLHPSFVFLWIQNFLGLLYLRFVSNPRIKRQAKDCWRKTERKDRTKTFLYVFFVWNQKTSQRLVEANCKENRDWKNSCAITRPLSKQAGNGNIQKQIDERSQNRGM